MRKNTRPVVASVFAITAVPLLGLLSVSAKAQSVPLNLTLQTPLNGLSNQTVTFSGRITDAATDEVFVNNIQFVFTGNAGSFLTVNQASFNTFFANVPGLFFAGDDITSPIFSLRVASNTPTGDYSGMVTLLGGTDQNAQNIVSNAASFTVRVPAVSAAPEPASLTLVGVGLVGLSGMVCRRKVKGGVALTA